MMLKCLSWKKKCTGVNLKPAEVDSSWVSLSSIVKLLNMPTFDRRGHCKCDETIESR